MTTDRELLEKAARAAGIKLFEWDGDNFVCDRGDAPRTFWNPLNNDGDALRLAVKLRMTVDCCGTHIEASILEPSSGYVRRVSEECYREPDPYAATRRAIVRAAAALGEQS